jgi:uncharacterized protein (TIGR02757 family)
VKKPSLHAVLEAAYRDHHSQFSKSRDPLSLVHGYASHADQEIAGFLTALLSYGNVRIILNSASKVLNALGPSPSQTLRAPFFHESLSDFRHRFTTAHDLEIVFHWLHTALAETGSLEQYFLAGNPTELPMRELLSDFVRRFTSQPLPPALEKKRRARERQLKYLISDPLRGSACKRLNMYLRWMVRPADGIDLGLWRRIPASSLILPLDTHVLQTIRALRWTKSNAASWKLAELATARLRRYCPKDPVRYDFSLCHLSMEGGKILHYKSGPDAKLE